MTPEIMSVKECADYLRIHSSTLYRLVTRRRIPHFRIGSEIRFAKSTIDEWILSQPSMKAAR